MQDGLNERDFNDGYVTLKPVLDNILYKFDIDCDHLYDFACSNEIIYLLMRPKQTTLPQNESNRK